jgi:hypothetical protein
VNHLNGEDVSIYRYQKYRRGQEGYSGCNNFLLCYLALDRSRKVIVVQKNLKVLNISVACSLHVVLYNP